MQTHMFAGLEFELRKAQDTIKSLRKALTIATGSFLYMCKIDLNNYRVPCAVIISVTAIYSRFSFKPCVLSLGLFFIELRISHYYLISFFTLMHCCENLYALYHELIPVFKCIQIDVSHRIRWNNMQAMLEGIITIHESSSDLQDF